LKSADHKGQLNRLKRIEGQVRGITNMVEDGKYCIDILTQIKATRSALKSLELKILENHLGHCVHQAVSSGSKRAANIKLQEILELLKKSSKS
jgi:DNA-binding FrmR family transcriptional regulator